MKLKDIDLPKELKSLLRSSARPDDFHTSLENIFDNWHIQTDFEEYKFSDPFELFLAAIFLEESPPLLPSHVKKAVGSTLKQAITESSDKKYTMESLYVFPPKPSRKKGDRYRRSIIYSVGRLIRVEGWNRQSAYQKIAEQNHKSPDTIRRIYERHVIESTKKFNKPKEYYYGKIKE